MDEGNVTRTLKSSCITCIELSRESEARGYSRHGKRHQVIEISIGGSCELQRPEADVVESFVVDAECFIRVFHQLVHREGSIVGLHHSVGYLLYWDK